MYVNLSLFLVSLVFWMQWKWHGHSAKVQQSQMLIFLYIVLHAKKEDILLEDEKHLISHYSEPTTKYMTETTLV